MKVCTVCGTEKSLDEFHRRADKPDGHRSECKECHKANVRKWQVANAEYRRKYATEWAGDRRANDPEWRERARESNRRSYVNCVERRREESKAYYYANKDQSYTNKMEWMRSHPERVSEYSRRRRARKMGAENIGVSTAEWDSIVARYGNQCAYCGKSDVKLTMDHVVPLSKGGAHVPMNLVPACRSCNSRKRDKERDVFLLVSA